MRSLVKWLAGLALALAGPLAVAQSNLGDLLDAGGKRLSAEEFKREVVQRVLVGLTPLGGELEVVYTASGTIQGTGANPLDTPGSYRRNTPISGDWKVGDGERICSQMQISPTTGTVTTLAARCQFWFKLGDVYFISDSDVDRRASILRRAIRPATTSVAAPKDLGQLLDAGATRLSAEDFKRELVQRSIVGPAETGGTLEIMYASNGVLQGIGTPPSTQIGTMISHAAVSGQWRTDGNRVCSSIFIMVGTVSQTHPERCQFWFRLGDAYFVSDSDTDRRASILRRAIKTSLAPVATPKDLGELLDAGGKKLSAAEFRRDIAQRTLAGTRPNGAGIELMYVANGSIQGVAQPSPSYPWNSTVAGEWTLADGDRVCTTLQLLGGGGKTQILPRQCQSWFRLGDAYLAADSDTDRRAKVVSWAIKP